MIRIIYFKEDKYIKIDKKWFIEIGYFYCLVVNMYIIKHLNIIEQSDIVSIPR